MIRRVLGSIRVVGPNRLEIHRGNSAGKIIIKSRIIHFCMARHGGRDRITSEFGVEISQKRGTAIITMMLQTAGSHSAGTSCNSHRLGGQGHLAVDQRVDRRAVLLHDRPRRLRARRHGCGLSDTIARRKYRLLMNRRHRCRNADRVQGKLLSLRRLDRLIDGLAGCQHQELGDELALPSAGLYFPGALVPGKLVHHDRLASHPARQIDLLFDPVDFLCFFGDQQSTIHSLRDVKKLVRNDFRRVAKACASRNGHLEICRCAGTQTGFLRTQHAACDRLPH